VKCCRGLLVRELEGRVKDIRLGTESKPNRAHASRRRQNREYGCRTTFCLYYHHGFRYTWHDSCDYTRVIRIAKGAKMASDKKIVAFPDVENKLQAPNKKSLFERQKAEAEAKRLREEAETKAVYEDFVKSFDDEDLPLPGSNEGGRYGGFSAPPPRRNFNAPPPTGPSSGRGLGFGGQNDRDKDQDRGRFGRGIGSLGPPPPNLNKKRTFEGFQQGSRREEKGLLAFDDYADERAPKRALNLSDDEDEKHSREQEKAAPKPTLRLASLPPGTSPAVIKALLPSNLTVDAVRILPPSGPGVGMERKSMSAIVTLAKDTPANDIDTCVNGLQNRYLGYGYYLNLHRHLSSAAISSSAPIPTLGNSMAAQPFGAKAVDVAAAGRGHAPPVHQRGFAPPTSYTPLGSGNLPRGPLFHVPVQAPRDIRELKLIHKVIESMLTHGPEFEALLMSRPDVQREEKWAWLWDPRSSGGVWYRWRLWQVLTGSQTRRGQGKYLPLFEGSSAWKSPDQPLAYEYTTRLDEFVSDSEYNSSDEDDSGDESAKRQHQGGAPPDPSALVDDGKAYLNPLEKAKLTHLLARLPRSTGQLRKGDVARVTAFAISHAGRGADEVVSMIISNIEKPFAYTTANPDHRRKDKGTSEDDVEDEESDTSSASLIGIYLISDILSSSSTSGVRHAWRYRQLFEAALKRRHVFEKLGRLERKMNWGRLRAEKWKRSVSNILTIWEGWCVFPQESQEWFVNMFNNPPLTAKEQADAKRKEEDEKAEKGKSKWKAVEVAKREEAQAFVPEEAEDDVDGEPMLDDENLDGEPMEDEDLDGEPMVEDEDMDGEPMEEDEPDPSPPEPQPVAEPPSGSKVKADPAPVGQPRRRPRAVDMFADSDDEEA
jgi:U2-associated protein SR140